MNSFQTTREAKEFLASRIVAEAKREGTSLSEIERKMLYFSESGWTLPDMMVVSAEFDRGYNQDEYEVKIVGLIQNYLQRMEAENPEELDAWMEAAVKLSEEDHYLTVMLNAIPAHEGSISRWLPTFSDSPQRQPGDRLRLWITALAILGIMALFITLKSSLGF